MSPNIYSHGSHAKITWVYSSVVRLFGFKIANGSGSLKKPEPENHRFCVFQKHQRTGKELVVRKANFYNFLKI
jgi:hypothetical protein